MRLWLFIFVLVLATGIGVLIHKDPGYAFFAYGDWTVEMPLWVSVILLILSVSIFFFILWILNTLFSSSSKIKFWWKSHKEHTARLQTYQGLLELAEGRWQKAERYLSQSARHSGTPIINYLSAANAAEEAGSPERRDRYLQQALEVSPSSETAVRLAQAQLQHKHGELEKSIENLKRLHEASPKNPKILKLLYTLYEAKQDYQSLFALLPTLRKNAVLSKEDIVKLEQKIYPALLPIYAKQGQKTLMTFWHQAPSAIQTYPKFVYDYAKLLIQLSEKEEAESVLRTALKKIWSEDLVKLYGLLISPAVKKQLSFAESLLSKHANDPILLLTVGRLCLRNQLWGKARDYLEQSIVLQPLPETYAELGQLMDYLGQPTKREEYYKEGLLLATRGLNAKDQTHPPLLQEDALLDKLE